MSEVINNPAVVGTATEGAATGLPLRDSVVASYLPAILAVGGAVALTLFRIGLGGERFITDGALMMLALACYLTAAVFALTDLYAPSRLFRRLGLWPATAGVFFNLASWGVRWVAA
ncbi:MAG: hypothetical protein ACRD68_11715, partial [Pyrinomonadaceae bacterium]